MQIFSGTTIFANSRVLGLLVPMQIQQFGFVFHYMDFNFLFQCVLWFLVVLSSSSSGGGIGCRLAEV
jgi:hypothetical protein